ncbi:helix-turn-helix domain-containing protein [Nannocystaceae bacterium ST9]
MSRARATGRTPIDAGDLPPILDAEDVAGLLRTTRTAVYAMVERRQLPGVMRIGRRVRFRRDALLTWLGSLEEPGPT